MPTLLIFILVFAVLVIVHEGGHFFAARLGRVEVDEFGLGLPPRFLTLWRSGGSVTISGQVLRIPRNFTLPFASPSLVGTVVGTPLEWQSAMQKEVIATFDDEPRGPVLRTLELVDPEAASGPRPASEPPQAQIEPGKAVYPPPPAPKPAAKRGAHELRGTVTELHLGTAYTLNMLPLGGFVRPRGENDPNVPGGLAAASPWTRLGVLLAGPGMNILLAALIFAGMFVSTGVPVPNVVYLDAVLADSPAEAAGFKAGDVIKSINGETMESIGEVRNTIRANLDQPIQILLERDGAEMTLTVTPSSQRSEEEGATGVQLANPVRKATLLSALQLGFTITGDYIREFLTLPARLIQNQVEPGAARFIGLKGMYDFMNEAVQRDAQSRLLTPTPGGGQTPGSAQPTYYTWNLIAVISLSLGIFNLLPLPALDGGRIMFLLPELIFRRRVPHQVENRVHAAGMVLLLLLMVVINAMDFINPVVTTLP
jgi:regulator of sigma E protease